MSSKAEYEKSLKRYHELAAAAKNGNASAKTDKARAFVECRAIKRDAARAGVELNATRVSVQKNGDKFDVTVQVDERASNSRRSLQEEYCRRFPETEVVIGGEKTTLQKFHSKRLLGR